MIYRRLNLLSVFDFDYSGLLSPDGKICRFNRGLRKIISKLFAVNGASVRLRWNFQCAKRRDFISQTTYKRRQRNTLNRYYLSYLSGLMVGRYFTSGAELVIHYSTCDISEFTFFSFFLSFYNTAGKALIVRTFRSRYSRPARFDLQRGRFPRNFNSTGGVQDATESLTFTKMQ